MRWWSKRTQDEERAEMWRRKVETCLFNMHAAIARQTLTLLAVSEQYKRLAQEVEALRTSDQVWQ